MQLHCSNLCFEGAFKKSKGRSEGWRRPMQHFPLHMSALSFFRKSRIHEGTSSVSVRLILTKLSFYHFFYIIKIVF